MVKENVEIFEEDSIVALTDENGESIEFYEKACVELDDRFYELLMPVEPMEGVEEDEVYIFEVIRSENEDDDDSFVMVTDDDLCNTVFAEYVKAAEDMEDGCDCCGCEECSHDDKHQ